MALISCYECNGQISTKAVFCPHCGAPSEAVRDGEADPQLPMFTMAMPLAAPDGAAVEPVAAQKTHLMSHIARAYFFIGGLVATPIMPTQGYDALIAYLAQYLLLGFGIAIMAFGYSREPRDKMANVGILLGWTYTLVIASAVISANAVRFT